MNRVGWRLSEPELMEWVDRLIDSKSLVIAPVDEDGLRHFRRVASPGEMSLKPGKTRWSPKEHLLPRTEPLYRYAFRGDNVLLSDPPEETTHRILFGLRSCDAAGLARLDAVFLHGVKDRLYEQRRVRTTTVTVACQDAGPECFCTAVGGSPTDDGGSDVMLFDLGTTFFAYPATEAGTELLAVTGPGWSSATEDDWREAREQQRRVIGSIRRDTLDASRMAQLEDHFEDRIWNSFGERCLSCGVCAYVCPSCTCFDVNQAGDVHGGVQIRSWDSCTFAIFTRHASGHNPRRARTSRFRQRLLHKFSFAGAGGDHRFRCVGCGRCVVLCPAGIDIHNAAVRISEAFIGEAGDGGG